MLYWHVGRRLLTENLQAAGRPTGTNSCNSVTRIEAEFGDGFSYSALTRMVRFAESFVDEAIVVTTVTTIGLVAFSGNSPHQRPARSRFLCGDVSN